MARPALPKSTVRIPTAPEMEATAVASRSLACLAPASCQFADPVLFQVTPDCVHVLRSLCIGRDQGDPLETSRRIWAIVTVAVVGIDETSHRSTHERSVLPA